MPAALPHRPVRALLVYLVLACLIPGLVGAALLLLHEYRAGRESIEQSSLLAARALRQAVDAHLAKGQAVAQAMSAHEALHRGDFATLHRLARDLLAREPVGNNFILYDLHGRQLVNTLREFGEPLPMHDSPEHLQRVLAGGRPAVSGLFLGTVSGKRIATIDVPVVIDGRVAYVLALAIRPEIFNSLLKAQNLPDDWIAAVFDNSATIIARTHAPEQFIGRQPSAQLVRRMSEVAEDVLATVTPDGLSVLSIYSRSPATGWTVALGIPRQTLDAAYQQPLKLLGVGMLLLFLLGLGLAWLLGNRIAGSVRALTGPAQALGEGRPFDPPRVHIREAGEVVAALAETATLLEGRRQARDAAEAALAAERESRQRELETQVAERTEALRAANAELETLARRDALTGLANRLAANERLRAEFLRLKRSGRAYAVLMLDIDHFKRINDTCGHQAGDHILQQVAGRLAANLRGTDFAARFGGEEFLVLLPETGLDGALTIAEKIRAAMAAEDFPVAGRVTVSLGAAAASAGDANEGEAVRRADAALYEAKSRGRNTVLPSA